MKRQPLLEAVIGRLEMPGVVEPAIQMPLAGQKRLIPLPLEDGRQRDLPPPELNVLVRRNPALDAAAKRRAARE